MKKEKKKKVYDDDSGVSFTNMNVEGIRGYVPDKDRQKKDEINGLKVSKKERRAMIRGAYKAFLPVLLVIIAGFTIVFLLFMSWVSCVK